MSSTDEEAITRCDHLGDLAVLDFASDAWMRPRCTLPPGHLDSGDPVAWVDGSTTHLSISEFGTYAWPDKPEDLVAVVTIENANGGILERWTQAEGGAVTKKLDLEALTGVPDRPPTIAVAIRRRVDTAGP